MDRSLVEKFIEVTGINEILVTIDRGKKKIF